MIFNVDALRTFGWLLWSDVELFLKDYKNNIVNSMCWPIVIMLSNGYIMTAMGMPADYGPFSSVSMLIIMASFGAWDGGRRIINDLEGPRSILYELTLPLPSWLVFTKYVLRSALDAGLFNLISLIIGKILFFNQFDLSYFSVGGFLLIYTITLLFFSTFALCGALFAGSSDRFFQLEIRFAGPLFFICGQAFPWLVLYKTAPIFGMLMLATPWLYAYEGNRAAVFGQTGYINYWICVCMLLFFFSIFFGLGLHLFKKRLDCV